MRFLDTLRDLDARAMHRHHGPFPCDACRAETVRDRLWHEARPRLAALVEAAKWALDAGWDKSDGSSVDEVVMAGDALRAALSALDEGGTP